MSKIGGPRHKGQFNPQLNSETTSKSANSTKSSNPSKASKLSNLNTRSNVTEQKVIDKFDNLRPSVKARLQSMNSGELAKYLKFDSKDNALLARTFYNILSENPSADRKKRSTLFAKSILKAKGLSKKSRINDLLDEDSEDNEENEKNRKALQELYEMIAEELDSTPVFARLVEEVTESAKMINLKDLK